MEITHQSEKFCNRKIENLKKLSWVVIVALILTRFYSTSSTVSAETFTHKCNLGYAMGLYLEGNIRTWGKTLEWFGILYQFLFLGWKRRWRRRFGRFLNMFLVGAANKCIKNFLLLIPLVTIYTTDNRKWSFLWCSYQATAGPSGLELPRENSVFLCTISHGWKTSDWQIVFKSALQSVWSVVRQKTLHPKNPWICYSGTTSFQNNI